jgi:hypothetical protein
MGGTSTKKTREARNKDPLPAPCGIEVVPISQVASVLGWPISRVRSATFLRPTRSADGVRLYDIDRVLAWAQIENDFIARSDLREAQERRAIRKVRRWAQGVRRWLRGKDVSDDRRLMAVARFAVNAEAYAETLRSGFDTVVAHHGLLCMLALIGTAATGLSVEACARYPKIPWRRVQGLAELHDSWDGRRFRDGMDVVVPLLMQAGMRTGIRHIDEPRRRGLVAARS